MWHAKKYFNYFITEIFELQLVSRRNELGLFLCKLPQLRIKSPYLWDQSFFQLIDPVLDSVPLRSTFYKKYIREENGEETKHLKKSQETCGRERHEECEQPECQEWRKATLESKENRDATTHSAFPPEIEIEQRNHDPLFCREIEEATRGRKACAASGAAMTHDQMGGHWKIVNAETKHELSNTLRHKE